MKIRGIVIVPIVYLFIITVHLYADTPERITTLDTMVTIGQSKIHCELKENGYPNIVFISGLGEGLSTWETIIDSVSHFATTLRYDRSGLGASEYHNEQKDLSSLVSELHTIILKLKIRPPFILVGHSLGCQIAKQYSITYPNELLALLFLDPGFNESVLKRQLADSVWQQRDRMLKKYLPKFSPAQEAELQRLNENCAKADTAELSGKIPVTLFTAAKVNPSFPGSSVEYSVKKETHELWVRTNKNAKHVFIDGSRHYIHNDVPHIVIKELWNLIRE